VLLVLLFFLIIGLLYLANKSARCSIAKFEKQGYEHLYNALFEKDGEIFIQSGSGGEPIESLRFPK